MARNVYKDFLQICAFEPSEIEKMLPDWIHCCDVLELTEEDVRMAVDVYIPTWWQIRYMGIRKMLGAFTKEAIDHSKLKEYKASGKPLVYGIMPVIVTAFMAIKDAGGDNVFVGFPDLLFMIFLQSVFHKGAPYFEEAEKNGMTYGARHCALDKMRIGGNLKGNIPTPTLSWSWGLVCDEGCKTDEYIHCLNDETWNYLILRIPHDEHLGEESSRDDVRVNYLAGKLREGYDEIKKLTGIEVSDKHLFAAVERTERYKMKLGKLMMLGGQADPPVFTGSTMANFAHPFSMPFNTGLDMIEEALDLTLQEAESDIAAGIGILPKGAPKVGVLFGTFSLPWIDKLFIENGVAQTFSMHGTPSMKELAPSYYQDPLQQIAEQWFRADFGHGCFLAKSEWREKLAHMNPDGMIMGYFDYDRWLGHYNKYMAHFIETELGIPAYYIESDFYDDRDYSYEALRNRIETICQIIKKKKTDKLRAQAAA